MMELKVTIKFSANFLQMILKYTLSLAMSVFERAVDFRISLYYTKKCRFAIFLIILLSKSVRRRLSIIKLFLKNFSKITGSYIYWRFLFNKVEGYRLKRNSDAGEFL